jgi:hypothetical protein
MFYRGAEILSLEAVYRLDIEGRLDPASAQWLGEYAHIETVKYHANLTSLVTRPMDSPALYGLLARMKNLNLTLVSVHRL